MLFAILDGKKVEPIPNTHAKCPACGEKVLSKCGEVKVWHWAHFKGKSCDSWYEPETYWHKYWKLTFGKENSEKKITKGDTWHIADILTNEEVIIELQNSSIQKGVIRKREEFYGERMIWLINGIKFQKNFYIKDKESDFPIGQSYQINCNSLLGRKMFKWDYPRRSWAGSRRHIFIDFHEEWLFWVKKGFGTKWGEGIFVAKQDFISKYGGDFNMYLRLFRNYEFLTNRRNLRFMGEKGKNLYLLTSIRYNGKPRALEIYFDSQDEILKVKKLFKVIISGTMKFEEKNRNLQLIHSKIIVL